MQRALNWVRPDAAPLDSIALPAMSRAQTLARWGLPWIAAQMGSGGSAAATATTAARAACSGLRSFSSSGATCQSSSADPPAAAPPAFVFDIDGVLIQGRHVLPQARRALARLYSLDGHTPRYPLAFLTNGGGVSEAVKAHQLSEWLGVHVRETQVVLSHTPFRHLAAQYGELPVLVAGRGQVRDVARRYGFSKVVTTHQLTRAMPAAVPFSEDQGLFPGADLPSYTRELRYGSEQQPIRAIMVFTDPSDWYRDLQLMADVVLSRGVPGRRRPPPDAPPVEVFFSNPDLLWANEFGAPRFGQGAFAACLDALHRKLTGEPLQARTFGKPSLAPYLQCEQLLLAQAAELGLKVPLGAAEAAAAAAGRAAVGDAGAQGQAARPPLPFSSVFMIGDNPASDVAGAAAAGRPWTSVLVTQTGVARGDSGEHPADAVVDDVEAAVEAALHRARHAKWHSMR